MKKLLLICLSALLLTGCGNAAPADGSNSGASAASADTTSDGKPEIDLTTMSSTMVYSQVSDMMQTPEKYMGKSVRMKGPFSIYQDPSNGKNYFAVIISDATACCAQGIEFVLEGDVKYPDDYPEAGTEITVSGEFDTYEEAGSIYCQLIHAEMQA